MNWFTADIHFWHYNVIKYCNRPWKTVEEMNQAIIENFNALVKPEDNVYCVGDFSMSLRGAEMRKYLNGTWYLIPGNHDKCHSVIHKNKELKKDLSFKKYKAMGFEILPETYKMLLKSESETIGVDICHFPFQRDPGKVEKPPKYYNLRPIANFETQVLLHGHIHGLWKTDIFIGVEECRFIPQINLGVDVWDYKPVSETELFNLAKSEMARAKKMTEATNYLGSVL